MSRIQSIRRLAGVVAGLAAAVLAVLADRARLDRRQPAAAVAAPAPARVGWPGGQPGTDVAATGEHLSEYRRELAVAVAASDRIRPRSWWQISAGC